MLLIAERVEVNNLILVLVAVVVAMVVVVVSVFPCSSKKMKTYQSKSFIFFKCRVSDNSF